MQPERQELNTYITNLPLSEEVKEGILARLQNEEISEELFNEIEAILQNELLTVDEEIKNLDADLLEKQAVLQRTKNLNKESKISLRDRHRAWLKEIFDAALIEGKKLAGEIDQSHEQEQHTSEENEIQTIKAGLNL